MKALSWILVFWPLAFAICIIIATELSDASHHQSAASITTVAHGTAVTAGVQQVSDTTERLQNLGAIAPVRP